MVSQKELEDLISVARGFDAIIRTKVGDDGSIIAVGVIKGAKGIGSDWMPPIQAAERLREFVASSRVIAAAAELLEAAEMALWYWKVNIGEVGRGPTERDDMAIVEAAIAKAKGGSIAAQPPIS